MKTRIREGKSDLRVQHQFERGKHVKNQLILFIAPTRRLAMRCKLGPLCKFSVLCYENQKLTKGQTMEKLVPYVENKSAKATGSLSKINQNSYKEKGVAF